METQGLPGSNALRFHRSSRALRRPATPADRDALASAACFDLGDSVPLWFDISVSLCSLWLVSIVRVASGACGE
jgi:hypothetical protein